MEMSINILYAEIEENMALVHVHVHLQVHVHVRVRVLVARRACRISHPSRASLLFLCGPKRASGA